MRIFGLLYNIYNFYMLFHAFASVTVFIFFGHIDQGRLGVKENVDIYVYSKALTVMLLFCVRAY